MVEMGQSPPNGVALPIKPRRLVSAAAWATGRFAAGLQNWRGNRCADGFGILTYHRIVGHSNGLAIPTWNVTPDRLRSQLAGLLARGFEAWPLTRIVEIHGASQCIPSNVFAVTFDDGYENNYVHAWPILRELKVPATIFLATNYLDTDRPFPFDDWSAAGSSRVPPAAWRPLSTKQCSEMLDGGLIELGAHTHSHLRFLGRCDEFRRDLRLCLDVLREQFGIDRPAFSFPFGDRNSELIGAARQLGVACCLSTRRRRVLPADDAYNWGRFAVEANDTPDILAAKLSGWFTTVATAVNTLIRPWASIAGAATRTSSGPLSRSACRDVNRTREASQQS